VAQSSSQAYGLRASTQMLSQSKGRASRSPRQSSP
jgi:hypothetical protein